MSDTIRFLSRLPLLTCTERAAPVYDHLRRQKPRIGRLALRMAAITISHHAALVTRNLRNFEDIDGLTVVDWSREEEAKESWKQRSLGSKGVTDRHCRDRNTARATVGKGLAVSAFPRYVPVKPAP